MTQVTIPRAAYDEIIAHGREGKPEEICGILRGKGLDAFEVFRGKNIATERIENYTVDPQTLLLQFKFEEGDYADGGTEMMGIYHTHPVSVAYPSATDAWNAHYPESIYFICSLEFDDAPVIRAFQMVPHYESETLIIDVAAIQTELSLGEIRPDSNVFSHFQAADKPIPSSLEAIAGQIPPPFYLLAAIDPSTPSEIESQVVPITEHPIQVVG